MTPEKFLLKRGLKRDKANYVIALIKFREALKHLIGSVNDKDVKECISSMAGNVSEEIEYMYELEKDKQT